MKPRTPLDPALQTLVGENLLTVTEVAGVLHVHRSKVYRLVQDGSLPAVHVGDSIRIRPADLRQYIHDNLRRGRRCLAAQVAEGVDARQEPEIASGGWRPPTVE